MDTEEMQAQATLFAKLARVMGKVRSLPKTGHNTHFNYKFVTDGAVSDAISAALAAENVAFIPSILESKMDGKITKTRFLFTFCCGDTGAIFQATWEGEGMDNQDKGVSKSATSAVKYFLLKTFLIDTGERADDPDNDAVHDKKGKSGGDKPATAKSTNNPPPTFDKVSGTAFIKWATQAFNLTDDELRDALDKAAGQPMNVIMEWPYGMGEAIGAVMAKSVGYDQTRLDAYIANLQKNRTALLNSVSKPFSEQRLNEFHALASKLTAKTE